MCGIACLINYSGRHERSEFESAVDVISHRGPDGRGSAYFLDKPGMPETFDGSFLLALGHRRLSILDLSEAGRQPMFSQDGELAITYNGEIYNYIELRDELRQHGFEFKSDCDTEVVIAAYRHWGKDCLSRFNGMWSFIIIDREKRVLFASRDRFGIKPLYYVKDSDKLMFASEIKQFFQLRDMAFKPNRKICLHYLATGYESPPETFFENIYAFPPAHFIEMPLDTPVVKPERYWFPDDIKITPWKTPEIIEAVRAAFHDAVRLRLRSDVPVGGCLSGGLDSSAIFTEMKQISPETTFTAFSSCFDQPEIDERPFMKSVVDRTRSVHNQVFPNAEGLASEIDALLTQHDEPIGSVSMYAQYNVMRAAREAGVPVLLDGQGGDELFSGYWGAYMVTLNHFKNQKRYGGILSHLLGACLPSGNHALLSTIFDFVGEYRKRSNSSSLPFALNSALVNQFGLPDWHNQVRRLDPVEYRKAELLKIHIPRLLKWEDRNSMAFSIESRVPFLDVNLVELILSVSPESNLHSGWNKYLFRKAMANRLPNDIRWRKDKMGFETPQQKWMRTGPLHQRFADWARQKEAPVSDFIEDFGKIEETLDSGNYDATAMFRLFCLDHWLRR